MLKLALSGTNPKFYEKFDLRGICKFIQSIGLNAIELVDANIKPLPGEKQILGVWSNLDIEDAKRVLEEENVSAPVLQFRFGFNLEIGKDIDTHIKEFKACIDAAEKLGTKTILHYLCWYGFDRLDMDLVHRYLDIPFEYAKSKRITLVLENEFENPATHLPEKMLEIMKEYHDPCFKTNFDASNYEMAGCEGYPYAYNLLKDYIGYAHLKNVCVYKPEYYDKRYEIGHNITGGEYEGEPIAFVSAFEGAVNIPALLARLISDGYDFYVTFEPHAELGLAMEDIKKDMEILKKYGFIE